MKTLAYTDSQKFQPFETYLTQSLPKEVVVLLPIAWRPVTTDWGGVPSQQQHRPPLFCGVPGCSVVANLGQTAVN